MTKILNKLFYIFKNILLPVIFVGTLYIVIFMFKRLDKELFGANLMEFLKVVIPFILLIIFSLINSFLNIKTVKNNIYFNITSFLVMLVISVFCYRALFDQNMFLWHKYGYNINFNYFSDQMASIKVMIYGLSLANILLIVKDKLTDEKKEIKETTKKVKKTE